jgi:putative oxidoreductase
MHNSIGFFAEWTPRFLSVLRIVTAFLFIAHGTQKLFNAPAGMQSEAASIWTLMGFGGILEFLGGGLLLIGLFTRPAAFILCGEMAVAYFMVHASRAFLPIVNMGELAVLYCFIFLFLSVAGGGEWSVDRLWRRHAQ